MKSSGIFGLVKLIAQILVTIGIVLAVMRFFNLSWDDIGNLAQQGITGIKTIGNHIKGSM